MNGYQGNAVIPNGVVYGQGVPCLGGAIVRRLFIEHASRGSITTPDFGVGASSVSARSGTKFWKNGAPIRPESLEPTWPVRIHYHHPASGQLMTHHVYVQAAYPVVH